MSRKTRTCFVAVCLMYCAGLSSFAQTPGTGAKPASPLTALDLSRLGAEANRQETLEGALKKGNIDFSQSTIHYWTVNPDYASSLSFPKDKEDLSVVDYAPTGELPIEMQRPTIYVMFNLPMVPMAKLGEPITSTPLLTINPPVAGVYRWYGTKVLSFQPDGPLVDQPRYTVTVSPDAVSLGGRRLGKAFTFEFHTEAVKIVNFYAGNDSDSYAGTSEVPVKVGRFMVLEFNQGVDPNHLRQFLSVRIMSPTGERESGFSTDRPAYAARLSTRTDRALLVTLPADPPENSRVTVTLKDKASPRPGYPVRSGDQPMSFHTVTPFRLLSLSANAYDMPRNNKPGVLPVYAQFSHPLDRKDAELTYKVLVNGNEATPAAIEAFGSYLRIGLSPLEPGDKVSLQAPAAVNDIYERPLSNPETVVETEIPSPYPFAEFPWGFHHLEAGFPPKFIWAGRNLDTLFLGREAADRFRFDLNERERDNKPSPLPQNISGWKKNRANYSVFDLKRLLNPRGFGTAYFNFRATSTNGRYRNREGHPFAIQVTDLGITTRVAYNQVLVWVNSLSGGTPVAGATVDLGQSTDSPLKTGITDASGFVAIPLDRGEFRSLFPGEYDRYYLLVSAYKDGDRADMQVGNSVNSYTSTVYSRTEVMSAEGPVSRVMIFTDRGLYKAGEELAFRGVHWIQDPEGFTPYSGKIHLELEDFRSGEVVWKLDDVASGNGGFAARFNLPKGLEPGTYRISYKSDGPAARRGYYDEDYQDFGVSFTIAEFRKLAFQVQASVPDRPYFMGDDANVGITASYLAGGSMPGAEYAYYWTRKPVAFAPPGPQWANFVFGPGNWEGERTLANGKGKLGPDGQASIGVKTDDQNAVGAAYDYVLETTVQDIDRQAIANTAHVMVHPASFYLGLRFAGGSASGWWSRFVSTGQKVTVNAVLVDPKGRPYSADTKLTAVILKGDWKATEQQGVYGRINTRWDYVETEVSREQVAASGGTASWSFAVKDAGDYLLTLEAKDPAGRLSKTVVRFYATGSKWVRRATETPSDIEMIADKELYFSGETAHILVRSPVEKGDYILTVEREGIFEKKLIHLEGGQSLIDVPVKEKYLPVFYVALTSFTKREAPPADLYEPDLGRPRSLFGIVGLKVSTKPVELDVSIVPGQPSYQPGREAEVTVRVTRNGQPVANAEVTALAVDRGVLDLINYHVPDPVEHFYGIDNFPLAVDGDDSRRLLMKPLAFDTSALTGGDGDKPNERADFRPLALFDPFVKTDARGEAKMHFKLPDSLTTYRLTAMAISGSRVGIREGELLVQNPINVRTALPRRFRNRDTAAAGVVMKNLTAVAQKVQVTVESTILTVGGPKTRSVEIPPNGAYELPFILSATAAGEGTITFTVRSDVVNERLTEKVIVELPLIKEAFTTVGTIARAETGATEGLILPGTIASGYGSLTLLASSTLRPYIEPGLSRLLDDSWWPYWGYYRRLLYSFAGVYTGAGKDRIAGLMADLKNRQQPDGGIYTGSYSWTPYIPDPYISLLAAHFQEFALSRGYELKEAPDLGKLLVYLDNRREKMEDFDPYYHAYNNMALAAGSMADKAYLARTEEYEDKLGLGGYGLLTQAYLAAGDKQAATRVHRRSKNFVMMGTQTIDLKDTYEVANYWSSEIAEMAILLKNSQDMGEDRGLIQRIAGSLNKSERHWQGPNDDFWTLLGFIPLLDAEGPAKGNATVAVDAAGKGLADFSLTPQLPQAKAGLEFGAKPLADLKRDQLLPLNFAKTGDTPVYYTMIMRYALPNETAFARDEGIEVVQRYETLDGEKVGERDLKLGETYRVRVDLSTTKRRQRLELLVPIPNGLEIIDPTFVTSGKFRNQGGNQSENINRETVYGDTIDVSGEGYGAWSDWDWQWYWYRPDSFALDNMMVYRWRDFYAGTRTVTFLVRVTTPGIYPTPPANASLEFEPEVFGRSEGKLFVVKP